MRLVLLPIILLLSFSSNAATRVNLQQAIDMALTADPRIEEKQAFVRKAEGLLQEAEGKGGLRYSIDTFLAIANGVEGGFYDGQREGL